jgi:integrase
MATTRRISPTSHQAIWNIYGKDGKRQRRTATFPKQAQARAHANKMEAEHEKRGIGDPDRHTVEALFARVLAHWKTRDRLAETSWTGYQRNLTLLAKEIGHIPVAKLSTLHIDEAFANLKISGGVSRRKPKLGEQRATRPLSERTLLHIFRVGSAAMKQAVRWKLIAENPFAHVDAPSPGKAKIRIMTDDEAARVYRAAVLAAESGIHPGLDLCVALLLTCGLRRSEIMALAFDAIDLDAGTLAITRTLIVGEDGSPVMRDSRAKSETSIRTMTIPDELLPMIRKHKGWISEMALQWGKSYRRDPLLLFPDLGGLPLAPGRLTARLRYLHRQADVDGVSPLHVFRHGMSSALIAAGTDIKTVSERLGHSTTSFTFSTYIHSVSGQDAKAAKQIGAQFKALQSKANQA